MGFNYYGASDIGKKQEVMEDAFTGFLSAITFFLFVLLMGYGLKGEQT